MDPFNIHYMAKTVETFKTFLFYMQQKLRHTGLEPNEGDLKDGRFWWIIPLMSKLNGGCLSAVVYQELQDDNNNTFLVANVIFIYFFNNSS